MRFAGALPRAAARRAGGRPRAAALRAGTLGVVAPVLAAFALAVGPPAPAQARQASATGSLTVTVTAQAERALRARGVTLRTTGRATRQGRRVTLPLSAGDARALRTAGALRLRTKSRTLTLGSPRRAGSNPRVTALVAGRRSTLLTLAVAPVRSASGVRLPATGARLTAAAERTIARRLKVARLPRTAFATVAASGTFAAQPTATPQPATPSGPCGTTTAGGKPPAPGTGEPPVKRRPAGARSIVAAEVTWRVRESFIRYMAAGEGTSASRGAAGAAPEAIGGAPPLVYSFRFPFVEGWCDPATGAARIAFTGTVAFRYRDHGIDLVVNDPEVELDGPASRVIFRMTGSGDTAGGNQRAVIETLDVSKAGVSASADAQAFAYERIPGAIPPGAASSVFAGYYLPGDPFGWVSISFTSD